METIWTVTNVVQKALNLLLGSTPEFAGRAQAVSSGTMATFNLGGINQFGERFGLHLLDPLAGGSGAFASHDGINAGGPVAVPVPAMADVESNEQVSPLFYLHRRLMPGSGGAGTHRGGNSAEIALTLRGIPAAGGLVMTHGAEVPNSAGVFGGWPGSTVSQRFITKQALDEGAGIDDSHDMGPKPGNVTFGAGDVFSVSWQGGGGYGDPFGPPDRDGRTGPARRAPDRRPGKRLSTVSWQTASRPTCAATAQLRRELRAERVGRDVIAELPTDAPGRALGPGLRVSDGPSGPEVRSVAGALLSRGHTRWRDSAHRQDGRPVGAWHHASCRADDDGVLLPGLGASAGRRLPPCRASAGRRPRPHLRQRLGDER